MKKVKLPTINKKNFPYDLVQVIWEDIVGDAGWAEIPDIKNANTAICCSLGYLVFQDDKKTIIMSDFIFEDNGKVKTGGGYTTLPTTNVLQIKKIKTIGTIWKLNLTPKLKLSKVI
jgi:hypothetical protein